MWIPGADSGPPEAHHLTVQRTCIKNTTVNCEIILIHMALKMVIWPPFDRHWKMAMKHSWNMWNVFWNTMINHQHLATLFQTNPYENYEKKKRVCQLWSEGWLVVATIVATPQPWPPELPPRCHWRRDSPPNPLAVKIVRRKKSVAAGSQKLVNWNT